MNTGNQNLRDLKKAMHDMVNSIFAIRSASEKIEKSKTVPAFEDGYVKPPVKGEFSKPDELRDGMARIAEKLCGALPTPEAAKKPAAGSEKGRADDTLCAVRRAVETMRCGNSVYAKQRPHVSSEEIDKLFHEWAWKDMSKLLVLPDSLSSALLQKENQELKETIQKMTSFLDDTLGDIQYQLKINEELRNSYYRMSDNVGMINKRLEVAEKDRLELIKEVNTLNEKLSSSPRPDDSGAQRMSGGKRPSKQ